MRAIDPVLGILTLQLDGGPIRQVPARYAAEHLEHGYALTGHAAQGLTIDRAFVLVRAEGALAEWGYVAASRARTETRLYAVGPELVDDAGLARNDPEPAARGLADALMRAAAEPSAVARAERGPDAPSPAQMARERLEREIESRGRLLASTRQQLGGLGWVGRRRHGPALREQIDGQLRLLADLRSRSSADWVSSYEERRMAAYNRHMATNRIVVDLGPDEQARLSAESRRRGVGAHAVIVDLVRALPRPDATQRSLEALARLRASRAETPEISEADIEAALSASRTELERRAVPDLDE